MENISKMHLLYLKCFCGYQLWTRTETFRKSGTIYDFDFHIGETLLKLIKNMFYTILHWRPAFVERVNVGYHKNTFFNWNTFFLSQMDNSLLRDLENRLSLVKETQTTQLSKRIDCFLYWQLSTFYTNIWGVQGCGIC